MTAIEPDQLTRLPVPINQDAIAAFCERWGVKEFALFGSVLREDFRPDSDVDVLVTFEPTARPSLFSLAAMEEELAQVFGRKVDLLERGGLDQSSNPYIKIPVLNSARVIHAR